MERFSISIAGLAVGLGLGLASGAEVWIHRNPASGPAEFGAQEIKAALEEGAHTVFLKSLADPLSKAVSRIILVPAGSQADGLLASEGAKAAGAQGGQAFALRSGTGSNPATLAIGGDEAGVLYGALEITERIRLNGFGVIPDMDQKPYLGRRGVKFNLPLDARTPSYSDPGDAGALGVATVWELSFWQTQLDEMARSRMNCLSLWNLNPFPSMVKVPEYPDAALADVKTTFARTRKGYSNRGTDFVDAAVLNDLMHVKTLSMDGKIDFWRKVTAHANSRGIEVYLFTWNMYTYGAEGKNGITNSQSNAATIGYFRKSVYQALKTYPDLTGFGITAGENLEGDKEGWLWSTYGLGVDDYMKENPGRSVRMIHRSHEGSLSEITSKWSSYPGPFDMSYKYSSAHVYSSTKPSFMNGFSGSLPAGLKTWLTVRNDDHYYFRFGDPEFVRAYIRNIPLAKVQGFYYGSDGYIPTLNFTAKDSAWAKRTDIEKNWYPYRLWGRLGYDPAVPTATFHALARKRMGASTADLEAWSNASKILPLTTRYHWGGLDFEWYPEGCLSAAYSRGFHDIGDFRTVGRMSGENPGSSGQVADSLKYYAARALEGSKGWRWRANTELRSTLGDAEALGHLGNYYAEKILAAAATGSVSLDHALKAAGHARLYAQSGSAQYKGQWLNRMAGRFDFGDFVTNAFVDIKMAGGTGLLPSVPARSGGALLEAETAALKGGSAGSANPGYTGSGYASFDTASGSSIEWTGTVAQAGRYLLEFRYALASGLAPMELRVNGKAAGALSFVPTGSAGTWLLEGFEADLSQGRNVITLVSAGKAPAIDHVNLLYSGPIPVLPRPGSVRPDLRLAGDRLRIRMPLPGQVRLRLYDQRGRLAADVMDRLLTAGLHAVTLPLGSLPAGEYFLTAQIGGRQYRLSLSNNPGPER